MHNTTRLPDTLTSGEARDLTGLSAPVETAAAQETREEDVFARADSLVLSTMHWEVIGSAHSITLVSETTHHMGVELILRSQAPH